MSKRQKSESTGNLKQIGLCVSMYTGDNDDFMPGSFDQLSLYTGSDNKIFVVSFDGNKKKDKSYSSYVYLLGWEFSNDAIKTLRITQLTKLPIVFEKPWLVPEGTDSLRVLYADGHVAETKIKDVHKKSCREVAEYLTKDLTKDKAVSLVLKNASKADQKR